MHRLMCKSIRMCPGTCFCVCTCLKLVGCCLYTHIYIHVHSCADELYTHEQINKNVALNKRLAESVADVIFSEVCEGLALSQREKLASLAENVEFDSEDTYREKLATLRNSYFPVAGTQRDEAESISESVETSAQSAPTGLMESYLDTLTRVSRK